MSIKDLEDCTICPRECHANRIASAYGFCSTNAELNIASVCLHKGEEPFISGKNGICNVFFAHCNLQCIYCQNYQISQNKSKNNSLINNLPEAVAIIRKLLNKSRAVGFVSPSHCIPQMKSIIEALHNNGLHPVVVMNTNSYDKVETLKSLEGLIDVYLPDLKYVSPALGSEYSAATGYAETAKAAIREMYRQKGSSLITGDDGIAESGLVIRHLVLPNHVEHSIDVLRFIAEEISTSVYISLMSQYYPTKQVVHHPKLNRSLYYEEYKKVVDEAQKLGFYKILIQEMESKNTYRPDFELEHPFEKKGVKNHFSTALHSCNFTN